MMKNWKNMDKSTYNKLMQGDRVTIPHHSRSMTYAEDTLERRPEYTETWSGNARSAH